MVLKEKYTTLQRTLDCMQTQIEDSLSFARNFVPRGETPRSLFSLLIGLTRQGLSCFKVCQRSCTTIFTGSRVPVIAIVLPLPPLRAVRLREYRFAL
jgi:hypothetical protein